jgi:hypothetical protein
MNASPMRQVMRYYDRSSDELIGELAAEPSDLRKMNRPGIRWIKLSVITRTDHLEVVHSVLRISHCAIDRARVISPKSEIRPERCAKEAHSANNGSPCIEHVNSQAPPLPKQLLRHIVYVFAVKLMITSDIHNRDRGEAPTRPLDAFNADVNVAGQDNDIGIGLWRLPILKLQMQIRKDANPHITLTP